MNKQLGTNFNVKHDAGSCSRKKLSVSVIESLDTESDSKDNSDTSEGELYSHVTEESHYSLQKPDVSSQQQSTNFINGKCHTNKYAEVHFDESSVTNDNISDSKTAAYNCPEKYNLVSSSFTTSGIDSTSLQEVSNQFAVSVQKLSSSTYPWQTVLKSKSPRLQCTLNQALVSTIIDSGAEINVMEANILKQANIGISPSKELAKGVNQLPLEIVGQSAMPITLQCKTNKGYKWIHLGLVLAVHNLGVNCIIGEPGKAANNIICLPRKKIILLAGDNDVHETPYEIDGPQHALIRAVASISLQPGDQIKYKLPLHMANTENVIVTPRKEAQNWLAPRLLNVQNGHIYLTNSSESPVSIKKAAHLADARDTQVYSIPFTPEATKENEINDTFQYQDFSNGRDLSPDFLSQISVDPDNVLTQAEKQKFHELHIQYSEVFTPQPGKYNGEAGYIENRIQFSSPPAPNTRTHIPNYSPSMNLLLAQKMDKLEDWGVLVSPEKVGVAVQFVSPSMLVPKADSPDFRLVTDFASLNLFIKRVPNTSATISQAKARIARANYVIHLDLSNYFYQCGLQKQDIQYLGTVHPFKGLKVYTCDPQGLKGASERSYEKLLRIFGDMVQQGQLAQMADGLHVLGSTVNDLVDNYTQVLRRASLCNLTFKPTKAIICPRNISLFGWDLKGSQWFPTAHTISTLTSAPIPTTVKQLRSFIGSFKQLSPCLPNYAVTINALEQIVAGKKSAEKIVWNQHLQTSFDAAKELAAHPIGIAEPRPDDNLQTYSDYSAETRAVGGRLVILRKDNNGEVKQLIGGFYNVILDKHKSNWLPCEGEACGIRLVLEHFKHHIRESNNPTVHFTDSQSCVLAWKRTLKGAFSASSRISTFLTGLSVLPVELRHRPGKLMFTSDYASRNPNPCNSNKCQICKFANTWEDMGDRAANIRTLSIQDIKAGKSLMPMIQRPTWKNIQQRDPIHNKLIQLINTQQLPESKRTKGIHTKVKLLHNLYAQGKLYVDKDGLILVKSPEGKISDAVISVPPTLFPGIVNALHLRFDHPSSNQLASLIQRYFYTPGWKAIVDEVSNSCHQCMTIRKLPKILLDDSTTPSAGFATKFSADVIERHSQRILIVREDMSQYTMGSILPDQTSDTLQEALVPLILHMIPDTGTTVRVDGATAFQNLQTQSSTPGTLLSKLKIKIEVGRLINKNKNPSAENAIQEVLKEILRLKQSVGPISTTDLSLVLFNINNRIRYNGYTPKEILFRRDTVTNDPIGINDKAITDIQLQQRLKSSESTKKNRSKTCKQSPPYTFNQGELVFLRNSKDKNHPRELYIVEDFQDEYILVRKLNNKLRNRLYRARPQELIPAPTVEKPQCENIIQYEEQDLPDTQKEATLTTKAGRPLRKAARKAHGLLNITTPEKKKIHTHGWCEEDQNCEDIFYVPIHDDEPNVTSDVDSSTGDTSPADTKFNTLTTDSDEDMTWDSSPIQYQLTESTVTYTPTTKASELPQRLNPLSRRMATSEQELNRSDAFRYPQDPRIPPPFPRNAPSSKPVRRSSRIPKPSSPSSIDLSQVADFTGVLPVPSTPEAPAKPRRTRRLDYHALHYSGERREGEERRRPRER